jgi:hypothetical protein
MADPKAANTPARPSLFYDPEAIRRKFYNVRHIRYVDALPGAGKTHAFLKLAAHNGYQQKFLYVAPTKVLLNEVNDVLTKLWHASHHNP